jgi:hypothetical protein
MAAPAEGAPSMHHSSFVALSLAALVLACWLGWRHYANARALLQDWARANRFRILHARRGLLMPPSMLFTTSKYQVVYHVSLYDESSHRIRSAWVRLGTRRWGVMEGDAVEVRWEDADRSRTQ